MINFLKTKKGQKRYIISPLSHLILLPSKYFTCEEYKNLIKDNQTDKEGNLIYLYTTNKDEQYSYIQAAKDKGYSQTGTKKGQAIYIAPLRPDTVASIKTWRSSRGAGRVGLTRVQRYAFFSKLQ